MSQLGDMWAFLTTASNWSGSTGIAARGRAHLSISLVATLLAAVLAIPPAVWLAHTRRLPVLSVAVANVGRAIPSFAVIALVLPVSISLGLGLGFWPTCVALVALAIPPIFTSTYAGVAGTSADITEAARGVGMTGLQVLRRVELPAALPLMMNGLRISATQVVATATLGALVGFQCLGSFVLEGLARPFTAQDRLLGGALLIIVMALAIDGLLGWLTVRCSPWTRRARRVR
ncbi:MAG TPA: ABC transporter permease [Ilumatobacter sp.]|nr:ABC transporter permease [Ilumatobacter sp.]